MTERTVHVTFRVSRAFRAAAETAETIRRAGFPAMLVGGCVRDLLNGTEPADFDLVTAARPEELQTLFDDCRLVGAGFGVSLVRRDGFEFEVATAREERNYLDGRHPELVRYTGDLALDAMRRDFTVNALRYDPASETVYDSVGGLDDLERGIIRTVGDAEARFGEDYLRMLRAVRFAARFRFEIEPGTWRAIRKLSNRCSRLAGERIHGELTRMLTGRDPARAMELLLSCGILEAVLPEAAALAGVTQPPDFHPEGDVWQHTMQMLGHMAFPDAVLAWSVLLHDIGKPATRTVDPDGRIRFFSHETVGAELVRVIAERLRFSGAECDAVEHAVRNHMRFAAVREMRSGKLRRMAAEPNFALELELHRLDCIACHGMMEGFVFLLDRLRETPAAALPAPWVTGGVLVRAGCRPGPAFRPVLEQVFDAQLGGAVATPEEAERLALALYARMAGKDI